MRPTHKPHSRMTGRFKYRELQLLFVVVATAAVATGPRTEASSPTEYEVKAAYLYNFAQFVEWPRRASPGGSFSICVLGVDPFGRTLDDTVAGQTIQGMDVTVRRVATPKEAAGCHILFISSSEAATLKEILTALGEDSILTVSDMPQFADRGGMIHFVLRGGRVRFEVNLAAAKRVRLTLSSQLLKVAVKVESDFEGRS